MLLEDALMVRDTLVGQHRAGATRRARQPVYGVIRIPRPDIELLELRRFDTGKTIGRGTVLALGFMGVLVMFLSGQPHSPKPIWAEIDRNLVVRPAGIVMFRWAGLGHGLHPSPGGHREGPLALYRGSLRASIFLLVLVAV